MDVEREAVGVKVSARKKNMFLRVALVALAVYIIVSLIQLQLQLDDGQQQLNELDGQLASSAGLLQELQEQSDNYPLYLEQRAREQGMSNAGESVYYVVPSED